MVSFIGRDKLYCDLQLDDAMTTITMSTEVKSFLTPYAIVETHIYLHQLLVFFTSKEVLKLLTPFSDMCLFIDRYKRFKYNI